MLEYFTVMEMEQLKGLKEISPQYFFSRLKNFKDFKETCYSMLVMQGSYLSSSFNLLIKAFKEIARAIYCFLTLDFSLSWKKTCMATQAMLASMSKFILELGLLVLHSIRVLTLLVTTLLMTIFSSKDQPNKPQRLNYTDLLFDLNNYREMLKEVAQEKAAIHATIEKILANSSPSNDLSEFDTPQFNTSQFFSRDSELVIRFMREKEEWRELISSFNLCINSYPDFDASRGKETGYIRDVHRAMVEHHEQVKMLAAACFKGFPNVDYQWQAPLKS